MKSLLTSMALLFSCQPAGETVSESKTFIDADACSIEHDYQYGLYKLKNAETGEISEIAVEIERAGEKITAVRIKQVGSGAEAERVVIKDLEKHDRVGMVQEELNRLLTEIEESEESSRSRLVTELEEAVERQTQGEREAEADAERRKKQLEIIDRLVANTRQEIASLEEQTKIINKQARDLGLSLEVAEQNKKEALNKLNIAKYGLPYATVFGTDESTGTQLIWLHLNDRGIWGIDVLYPKNGQNQTMSYDPFAGLGSIKAMKEEGVRDRYFPTAARDCGSNSNGSEQN